MTTIAGTDWLFPGDGRPAVNAPLSGVFGGPDIAVDSAGNVYVCDVGNGVVLRIGPDGMVNVVAGNGLTSYALAGDGGPAINSALSLPGAMTLDRAGNLYIFDTSSSVRKITPDGAINVVGGTSSPGYSGDTGPALRAQFNGALGVAVDGNGVIYVADSQNFRIRRITLDGIVRTVAGTGISGLSGDGGAGTSAQLLGPTRVALDGRGNLYFVDQGNVQGNFVGLLRKLDANGAVTTISGRGSKTGDGPAGTAQLLAMALAIDPSGNIYVADAYTAGIRKVDAALNMTTIAGSGTSGYSGDGGAALKAKFSFKVAPALAFDPKGNLYVSDDGNARIRKIDPAGNVTLFAGNGLFRFAGNGGPATSATMYIPSGMARDSLGNLFISEPAQGRIRKVAKDGTISVYAGTGVFDSNGDGGLALNAAITWPSGLAIDTDGSLLFADPVSCVVRRIDTAGFISTYAGTGTCSSTGDSGPPTKATLNNPQNIAVDAFGDVAISDQLGNKLRVVISGVIHTLAGTGVEGYSGDGGSSVNAKLNQPGNLKFYGNYLYFSDNGNHVVRRIDVNSLTIETVAGRGTNGFSGDGGPANRAYLDTPQGLEFDAGGNLYIADSYNGRIRQVGLDGIINTIGGGGLYPDDGVPSTIARMLPEELLMDADGNLLFSDYLYNRVRAILKNIPTYTASPTSLTLSAPAGGVSSEQTVAMSGTITGLLWTLTTDQSWLNATPTEGAMPSVLHVTADASKLTAGTYRGIINIQAVALPFSRNIAVNLTVTAAGQPSLQIDPSTVQVSYVQGGAVKTRPLTVSNAGGGLLPVTVSASGGSWLSVSPITATLSAYGSQTITVSTDPGKLPPGTYSGTVTLLSAALGQRLTVPVTMTVSSVQQTLVIPQAGLAFYAVEGSGTGSALPQSFSILNTGQGQMPWSITGDTLSGGYWLNAFPLSGVTDAGQTLVPQVRVDVDPGGLPAGNYHGKIAVAAPQADNTPQYVSVELNILPKGSKIGPVLQPSGMLFTGVSGAASPGSQTLSIQNTSGAPVAFTATGVVKASTVLVKVSPETGIVLPTQPFRLVIQPQTAGLAAGVYRSSVGLSFADGSTRNVAVVIVVAPAGTVRTGDPAVTSSELDRPAQVTGCSAKQLVPVFTLLADGQPIPSGWPGQVTVKVIDDCLTPMTTGGVTVTFDNGDAPVRLTSLKDGTFAGTWIPRAGGAPQIKVTALASIPERQLNGQAAIRLGVQGANASPVLSAGGIVNAASYNAQTLAPGSLIALYGSKLADTLSVAGSTPLPTDLGGGSVVIAGKSMPLLFTSDGQVNAMIPFGIPPNSTQQVVAFRGTSISVPQSVTIAAAAPGIFTTDGKQGIIVDAITNKVLTPGNPTKVGEYVVIYCTGLGEVTPAQKAGEAASSTVLSSAVATVTATIGGVNATVFFAGLTPTQTGLYQLNVQVPPGVAPGDAVPVVVTAAGQVSAAAFIGVK